MHDNYCKIRKSVSELHLCGITPVTGILRHRGLLLFTQKWGPFFSQPVFYIFSYSDCEPMYLSAEIMKISRERTIRARTDTIRYEYSSIGNGRYRYEYSLR